MSLAVVLLTAGSICIVAGGTVALNIRGTAQMLARRAADNSAKAMQARGDLGPAPLVMSAGVYRFLATATAFGGLVLTLGGLLELA
ncbi:hypothetical protein [Streptomyces sp. NBC_01443]|uniref:hypothetical protein n=1 Tax=Streptomyces sp. NBC_01443 TaxID=2903868 RepID=UPI00224F7CC0|nr:hypothetical protein [Streptomyces sp. NBC_01443]MCX4632671.1 hypothetical protein [Streptomyces sp. NBC_01443]